MGGKGCKLQATSAIREADTSGLEGALMPTLTGKYL